VPETVRYDLRDGVATITLHRPAALNALTGEMTLALRAALEEASADPAVRAVVLTGSGEAFCAGQDVHEQAAKLAAGHVPDGTVRERYNPVVLALAAMPKPVIAAVNGIAAGAGAGLAFACDLIVAAEDASFLLGFTRAGLSTDTGVAWTLQRLVGRARAAELLLLAEPVGAAQAAEIGLINRVALAGELESVVWELAESLGSGPTRAYAAVKAALDHAANHDLATSLEREAELQDDCVQTADHRNATEAFLKNEPPVFEGR
jgi:2-(1,2-epoxy-1,2-dihydrophenyl)acetyl-CoA isomerase